MGNTGEGEEWGIEKPLSFVKFEDSTHKTNVEGGTLITRNLKMFYDLVNSKGLDKEPVMNSIVCFNKKYYKIVDTLIYYANENKIHHYEITLTAINYNKPKKSTDIIEL